MNNKTFRKKLAELDRLINAFEGYALRWPKSYFSETLYTLRVERAELTNKIGKGK